MSLVEAGHSTGGISLDHLLHSAEPSAVDPGVTINDLAEWITVGGWPNLQDRSIGLPASARRGS